MTETGFSVPGESTLKRGAQPLAGLGAFFLVASATFLRLRYVLRRAFLMALLCCFPISSLYIDDLFAFRNGTMITARTRFNIYFLFSFVAVLLAGCQSAKRNGKEPLSTVRVHIEMSAAPMDFTATVPVYRGNPVMVTVYKEPFLTEGHVASAKVVEVLGGFDLQVQFNHSGTLLLEQYTTSNPGRHLAVFSTFGKAKAESRWLAAPEIRRRISNGLLTFTPDASRAEAERIAEGLNNFAKQQKAKSRW